MRVVFFAPSFFPKLGGVERHVHAVAEELVHLGHSVTVITPMQHSNDLDAKRGYSVIYIPKYLFFSNPANLFSVRNIIRSADILHAHDFLMGLMVWPWAKLLGKSFFITFHGWEGRVPPDKNIARLRRWIERSAAGSILVGEFQNTWYGHSSKTIIYGGAAPSTISLTPRQTPWKIIYVGRVAADTGIREYLHTFESILSAAPQASLTIVGDGPLRSELEGYSRENKLQVKWIGWSAKPEKEILDAEIVFTSGYLGIIEALTQGKTVAALSISPLKNDYLRMAPFAHQLIIGDTPEELSRLITTHRKPVQFDRERFSWKTVTQIYLDLWKNGKRLVRQQ